MGLEVLGRLGSIEQVLRAHAQTQAALYSSVDRLRSQIQLQHPVQPRQDDQGRITAAPVEGQTPEHVRSTLQSQRDHVRSSLHQSEGLVGSAAHWRARLRNAVGGGGGEVAPGQPGPPIGLPHRRRDAAGRPASPGRRAASGPNGSGGIGSSPRPPRSTVAGQPGPLSPQEGVESSHHDHHWAAHNAAVRMTGEAAQSEESDESMPGLQSESESEDDRGGVGSAVVRGQASQRSPTVSRGSGPPHDRGRPTVGASERNGDPGAGEESDAESVAGRQSEPDDDMPPLVNSSEDETTGDEEQKDVTSEDVTDLIQGDGEEKAGRLYDAPGIRSFFVGQLLSIDTDALKAERDKGSEEERPEHSRVTSLLVDLESCLATHRVTIRELFSTTPSDESADEGGPIPWIDGADSPPPGAALDAEAARGPRDLEALAVPAALGTRHALTGAP